MKFSSLFAIAAALVLGASAAQAADAPIIAVVNIQQIMKESTAAQMVRQKLEEKQKSFQTELNKKDEQLQKEEKELAKQKGVLAKDAFEEKASAFRKKVTEMQKEVQTKKATLDNAYGRAIADIQKAVTEIVAELAKEKGFQIAIPMEAPPSWQILYADSKLDISSEVLSRLNKKLPKLEVKFEAPEKK